MEYRTLGSTGITVSTACLGTMMFGAWGNPDHDECTQMVDAAFDAGINFFDTADVYAFGESEEILGAALQGRRDDVLLATKFHNPMGEDLNTRGNSRRWIVRACENSLRRLRTDWIDLYQIHRPDPTTDLDETLGALDDLVHAGKVRAVGTSTFPAADIVEAQWVAQERRLVRPRTEQPPYSILARGIERAVLPACQRYGIGVLTWAPLNGGWLTGKYNATATPPSASRADREPDHFDYGSDVHERKLALVDQLLVVARDAGTSLTHLAHAFALAHPAVTSTILGPRTLPQLLDVLAGADVRVEIDVLDRIDAIVPPGVDVNPRDAGYDPPSITDASRRRRPATQPR
ncbi:MAG TPA: aldo/keto reductase [Acidimicrobiales bacterium]|jgi:aryl-alcohol dehydrogenase-like predicted oxidoreductase|nr:aldo/keto reductase [Acidimicrobiales bacterium]